MKKINNTNNKIEETNQIKIKQKHIWKFCQKNISASILVQQLFWLEFWGEINLSAKILSKIEFLKIYQLKFCQKNIFLLWKKLLAGNLAKRILSDKNFSKKKSVKFLLKTILARLLAEKKNLLSAIFLKKIW